MTLAEQFALEEARDEARGVVKENIDGLVGRLPARVAVHVLRDLELYCNQLRRDLERVEDQPIQSGRDVAETIRKPGGLTLQLEYVKCGKEKCKTCGTGGGKGHGPYWYGYHRIDGKVKSVYIGKDRTKAAEWGGVPRIDRKEA